MLNNDNLGGATICFEGVTILRVRRLCGVTFSVILVLGQGVVSGMGNDSGKDKVSWKYGGMGG